MPQDLPSRPSFRQAFYFWLWLGFVSFGGPAGQIAIMHDYLVSRKKWISDSRFMHALNYCMVLPGPEAQQLATYIGWLFHGTLGGLVAGLLFILPSVFILLILSWIYVSFGDVPAIHALFSGLKPAIVAIVLLATLKIGQKSLLSAFHYFIALAAFICIFFFNIPFPIIIIAAMVLAAIAKRTIPHIFAPKKTTSTSSSPINEGDYLINQNSPRPALAFSGLRLAKQLFIGISLWATPLVLLAFLSGDFRFWWQLCTFFTQAAFVTFGGAYAVLPYVAQVSVEQFQWLTQLQMMDGLALGETTPGPLVMVLSFVGFMAGHNHFSSSLAMGSLGLLLTTFYTFLPSFLFIFIGAPLIERSQQSPLVQQILSIVSAAVVGVILNLGIYLARSIVFPQALQLAQADYLSLFWIVTSLVALHFFKLNMLLWIGISALFGCLVYLEAI